MSSQRHNVHVAFYIFSWQVLHLAFGEVQQLRLKRMCSAYQKTVGSETDEPLRKQAVIAWWTWKWGCMEFIQKQTRDWSEFQTQPQDVRVQPMDCSEINCTYCNSILEEFILVLSIFHKQYIYIYILES